MFDVLLHLMMYSPEGDADIGRDCPLEAYYNDLY